MNAPHRESQRRRWIAADVVFGSLLLLCLTVGCSQPSDNGTGDLGAADMRADLGPSADPDDLPSIRAADIPAQIFADHDAGSYLSLGSAQGLLRGELVSQAGLFYVVQDSGEDGEFLLRPQGCLGAQSVVCAPSQTATLRLRFAPDEFGLRVASLRSLDASKPPDLGDFFVPHDGFKPESAPVVTETQRFFMGPALAFVPGAGSEGVLQATCELTWTEGAELTIDLWSCGTESMESVGQRWRGGREFAPQLDGDLLSFMVGGTDEEAILAVIDVGDGEEHGQGFFLRDGERYRADGLPQVEAIPREDFLGRVQMEEQVRQR